MRHDTPLTLMQEIDQALSLNDYARSLEKNPEKQAAFTAKIDELLDMRLDAMKLEKLDSGRERKRERNKRTEKEIVAERHEARTV